MVGCVAFSFPFTFLPDVASIGEMNLIHKIAQQWYIMVKGYGYRGEIYLFFASNFMFDYIILIKLFYNRAGQISNFVITFNLFFYQKPKLISSLEKFKKKIIF